MRLAGQTVMGHFPTPPRGAERIGPGVKREGAGIVRALDPCCGEGTALRLATQGLGTSTEWYGGEPARQRARAARAALTQVLHADLRDVRISHGAFGLLYLNPPYDFDAREGEELKSERLERVFLQLSGAFLQPAGVLVYLIPAHRLDVAIARLLAFRFERLRAFRFPDPDYQPFRQIIVFGVRKAQPFRDDAAARAIDVIGQGAVTPEELPENPDIPYRVPPAPPGRPRLFQSAVLDPEDLFEEIEAHGLYPALLDRLHPAAAPDRLRPLMPLRRGHLALVVASGYLDNEVVEDRLTGERFLVKGTTRKETIRTETQQEGTLVITERDVLRVSMTALDLRTGGVQVME